MPINKKFLVDGVAENFEVTKANATRIVDLVFDTIATNLQLGSDIEIHGFGKFVVTEQAARTARNPRTGEMVDVPARLAVKFKPSKVLKDKLGLSNSVGEEEQSPYYG